MCCIGGFISSQPMDPEISRRLASALLFYGARRGQQSSGVYVDGHVFKRAQPARTLILTDAFVEAFAEPTSIVLTHNRQPTCGALGDQQAHPFQIDTTASVHNGMVVAAKDVAKEWGLSKPSGVDSELITSLIHTKGIEKLPEFISQVDGPSSVAAVHGGDLWFYRHNNPLVFTQMSWGTEMSVLVFGSTQSIVQDALQHVWLLEDVLSYTYPAEDQLYRVASDGVTRVGPTVARKTRTYTGIMSSGYVPHRYGSFLGEDDPDVSSNYTLPRSTQTSADLERDKKKDAPVPTKSIDMGPDWEFHIEDGVRAWRHVGRRKEVNGNGAHKG